MVFLLILLLPCLSFYLLGLFFQFARMEDSLENAVAKLEAFLIREHGLQERRDGDR